MIGRQRRVHEANVIICLAVVTVLNACGGVDQSAYVERNLVVLEPIAPPVGAVVTDTESAPYELGDSGLGGPDGFVTTRTYSVDQDVDQRVIVDHYDDQLTDWTRIDAADCVDDCEQLGDLLSVTFIHDGVSINIVLDSVSAGTFLVSVDHDAKRQGG